ncbi:MAG: hypothetical protein JWP74_1702 [Marmoricola sp.]|nr:hypothetical protein [Marmoricola sp.]
MFLPILILTIVVVFGSLRVITWRMAMRGTGRRVRGTPTPDSDHALREAEAAAVLRKLSEGDSP